MATVYPKVEQPSKHVNLFDHQLTAIYNMENLEQTKKVKINNNNVLSTNIGIYSDPTGYGKTLSVIGLILRDRMKYGENGDKHTKKYSIKHSEGETKSIQIETTYK